MKQLCGRSSTENVNATQNVDSSNFVCFSNEASWVGLSCHCGGSKIALTHFSCQLGIIWGNVSVPYLLWIWRGIVRNPHALHKVLAPSGPLLHSGVSAR